MNKKAPIRPLVGVIASEVESSSHFDLTLLDQDGARRRVAPRNIYCIGRNYAAHAAELGNAVPQEPIVFLKTSTSLRAPERGQLAFADETFHHEAELVLLVGRKIELGQEGSWQDVTALALGLDLTRRDVQAKLKAQGLPWTSSKSFAGSAVVTPFVMRTRFSDPDAIQFTLHVEEELRQEGDTQLMLFKIPTLLTHLARSAPLLPGDLVYTGTPVGVGPIRRGDRFKLGFPKLALSWDGQL